MSGAEIAESVLAYIGGTARFVEPSAVVGLAATRRDPASSWCRPRLCWATSTRSSSGTPIDAGTRQSFTDVRTVVLARSHRVHPGELIVGVTHAGRGARERRDLYISLDLIGMPQPEMNQTRRLAVGAPLRVAVTGSALATSPVLGAVLAHPERSL